jgi:molybdate transport system regulatory protein
MPAPPQDMPMPDQRPALRIRIVFGPNGVFGPGKADLLESIADSGSISAAARAMRMSYKRAWQLVDDMNRMFASPLVATTAGGMRGGGAALTPGGRRALAAYRRLQRAASQAAAADLKVFTRLARAHAGRRPAL